MGRGLSGTGSEGQGQRTCGNCGAEIRPGNASCVACGEQTSPGTGSPDRAARADSFPDGFTTTNPERTGWSGTGLVRSIRDAYQEARAQYRNWSEAQAAERERNETLRAVEREREARRSRFLRYERFFERARGGSQTALDWWQAYETGEPDDEQPPTSALLRSARDRAEAGLRRAREAEGPLADLLREDLFGEADRLLDDLGAGQEDLEGEESVLAPLVTTHDRIERLDGWANYRAELERFIGDLENLLGSPTVRTTAANRARFPDPHGPRGPEPGEERGLAPGFPPPGPRDPTDAPVSPPDVMPPGTPPDGDQTRGRPTAVVVGTAVVALAALALLYALVAGGGGDAVGDGVVLRVSGPEGASYTGAYSVMGEIQTFRGTLGEGPRDYKLPVAEENENIDIVYATVYSDPGDEELTAEIFVDGEVVESSSGAYVEVRYDPQATSQY